MTRRRRGFVGALVSALSLIGAVTQPAAAQIDASGRWFVRFFIAVAPEPSQSVETWVQSGTTLTSDAGFGGTIDPVSGEFNQLGPPGDPFGVCPPSPRSGTVAADGRSFTATGVVHGMPGCVAIDAGWEGTRCGEETIDALEQCDDGNIEDGDGCSATCELEECFACSGQPSRCTALATAPRVTTATRAPRTAATRHLCQWAATRL